MSVLERSQKIAFWVAVVCAALGFLSSAGCVRLPRLPSEAAVWLHPVLLVLGLLAGLAAVGRNAEIDRERWRVVEDPLLTSGERDYAHKRAERQRRWAGTAFISAPLMLGYWMAYQIEGEGRGLAAQVLPATALLGSVLGLLAARFIATGPEQGTQKR
jgi:hypothetical protein